MYAKDDSPALEFPGAIRRAVPGRNPGAMSRKNVWPLA
jgi:hypothetical protein